MIEVKKTVSTLTDLATHFNIRASFEKFRYREYGDKGDGEKFRKYWIRYNCHASQGENLAQLRAAVDARLSDELAGKEPEETGRHSSAALDTIIENERRSGRRIGYNEAARIMDRKIAQRRRELLRSRNDKGKLTKNATGKRRAKGGAR